MKVDMIKRNNTEYPLVALNTIVTCQNNPSTQIKTGTINGFTLNNQSESFKIYLPNGNTANNIKLNISNSNGETGAKDIKIYKEGSLVDVASDMDVGTILEVFYDGTQYIVIGNPIVKQTSDYTIYADGRIVYNSSLKVKDFADFNEAIPLGNTLECFMSSYKPSNSPNDDINYWYCITMRYNHYGLTNTMQLAISLNSADVYVRVIGVYSWNHL